MKFGPILAWSRGRPQRYTLGPVLPILAALILGTATACSPTTPTASSPSTGPNPTITVPYEMPVTIAITGIPDDQTLALLDEQIARFEQENPDILVEVVKAPRTSSERHDAFAARLAEGDNTRDIYILDPTWLAEFEANGWLAPLDERAGQQGLALSESFSSTLEANTIEGQLIALPWAVDGGLSLALSPHSLFPEQAFRFMAFLAGY
jgi:multiple sugar transport system substrate-binding protein